MEALSTDEEIKSKLYLTADGKRFDQCESLYLAHAGDVYPMPKDGLGIDELGFVHRSNGLALVAPDIEASHLSQFHTSELPAMRLAVANYADRVEMQRRSLHRIEDVLMRKRERLAHLELESMERG